MRSALLLLLFLAGVIFWEARAQVPQGTQLRQNPSMTFYRDTPEGKRLDFVISGNSVTNLSAQNVLVYKFDLKSFRNGDAKQIQIIAQAPQCQVNLSNSVASDAGPLQVFTPTTNLFVQGVGFIFTQSNHFLVISNQVETRVAKALLRSSPLAVPRTNAATDTDRIFIFADSGRFDFNSNEVDYAGGVHMIDPQLDLTSDLLTVRFASNGAVESILARQNVVLTTTNHGRATGATGLYYVTNGNEIMRLTTDAKWRNGNQAADAQEFIYDSTRHFLTGSGNVKVRWPNGATNAADSTNGFRVLFADYAGLQFPQSNGPVQSMHATGHVIIVNEADQSRAMSDEASYERSTDRVELTGHPVWWNNDMEVKAEMLSAELAGKTYHAWTNAHFKMRTGAGASGGHSTNQWVYISSDNIAYQTNQAVFDQNVETRLLENDQLRDILHCALLTIDLTNNQVESAFAFGHVHGETAPDAAGVFKTITCEQLNTYRSVKTGLMQSVDAHTNVVIEEKGTSPGAPCNKLTADTVTAQFSAVTNQIEKAVAGPNVVLDQLKGGRNTHATSEQAVYTAGANDEVKLTGTPLAHTDSYNITDSDFMIWKPKANVFQAFGLYKIVPIKPAAGAKSL
jgi:lipopolysaccharide export system protein LptA